MGTKKYSIGVDIGGTTTKFGIVSSKGIIQDEYVQPTLAQEGPEIVIDNLISGIHKLIGKKKLDDFRGVGIGVPGKADKKRSSVSSLPNFKNWQKVELKKILQRRLKIPTSIDNDANCAALGELYFGAGKDLQSFILVTLGTGVGSGIVIDKKLLRGDSGGAGELGHITIDYNGPDCNCGQKGCVEAFVGNSYIKKRTIQMLNEYPDSLILKLIDFNLDLIEPKIVSEAAYQGDTLADKILKDTGRYMGIALASAINILDIKNVIVGGGVAAAGEKLLGPIEKSVKTFGIKSIVEDVVVIAAELKNTAGVLGASTLLNEEEYF